MDLTMSATVLLVDDEEPIRELAERTIGESHPHLELTTLASPDEALAHLERGSVDCVVTDYSMPGTDGLAFLEAIRERDPHLPVVFFTGRGSEALASEAITAGVTDYIRKEPGARVFERLGSRIETLVRVRRAERAAREADRRVAELFDRISDAVLSLDDEGRVVHLPREAERLFGPLATLAGERLAEAVPSLRESAFEGLVKAARTTGRNQSLEFDIDGGEDDRRVAVTAYPAADGISVFVQDLTPLKERDEEIRELADELEGVETQFRTLTTKLSRPVPPNR